MLLLMIEVMKVEGQKSVDTVWTSVEKFGLMLPAWWCCECSLVVVWMIQVETQNFDVV